MAATNIISNPWFESGTTVPTDLKFETKNGNRPKIATYTISK